MTYEEFCELKDSAEKAKAELDQFQRAISRIYGPHKLSTLIEEYTSAMENDNRSKAYDLYLRGKL